ncbi:MAG TPA: tRNA uridine-5-carboxymethylaminomethyl(34) synthesis GTPase MnmE [Nevskiaceae bacterium]|nr:tRNA uridine-5-carboxymethylaminomethyl(34) synthesis GTPase MnmE [Nevskiaceae bacterium]
MDRNGAARTIAALASAPGRAAVGILRCSGPAAGTIAEALTGRALPPPREARLRQARAADASLIDEGLLLWFPSPGSYTGEPSFEFQAHGGRVLLDWLLQRVIELGAEPARPGEFTERAFLNGRLDLAQAEGVAAVIEAASRGALRAAQRSLQGEFSQALQPLAEELLALRVFVEGALDFSDEDIDWLGAPELHDRLQALAASLQRLTEGARLGRRLHEGLTVLIAGPPNAGKSTLLNRLAGSEVAIVSPEAGTTRDLLREPLMLGDLPLTLVDSAGLRETGDPIEAEGMRRARQALQQAELVLLISDAREPAPDPHTLLGAGAAERPVWLLRNKADLSGDAPGWRGEPPQLSLSAATGAGCEALIERLRAHAGLLAADEIPVYAARGRQLEALREAAGHLQQARAGLGLAPAEQVAEELRLAHDALGRVTGAVGSEDLLGAIFSRFCIGK